MEVDKLHLVLCLASESWLIKFRTFANMSTAAMDYVFIPHKLANLTNESCPYPKNQIVNIYQHMAGYMHWEA